MGAMQGTKVYKEILTSMRYLSFRLLLFEPIPEVDLEKNKRALGRASVLKDLKRSPNNNPAN